jgi:hypothetical protein
MNPTVVALVLKILHHQADLILVILVTGRCLCAGDLAYRLDAGHPGDDAGAPEGIVIPAAMAADLPLMQAFIRIMGDRVPGAVATVGQRLAYAVLHATLPSGISMWSEAVTLTTGVTGSP